MISLDEKQQEVFDKLINKCEKIEADLGVSVSHNEPNEIQLLIERLRVYLADVPKMLSDATSIYDFAKGRCAEMIMEDDFLLNSKANIQKMWIDGKLEKYNELFVRVECTTKSLDKSISGLVSQLSMEKEKVKHNIHQD